VENNVGPGIDYEVSYDAVISKNTIQGNGFGSRGGLDGAGILLNSSGNVKIFGNRVRRNRDGIGLVQAPRGSGRHGPHVTHNVTVHDNTITMVTGSTGLTYYGSEMSDQANETIRFQRNTYYLNCKGRHFVWSDPSHASRSAYLTRAQWVAAGNDTKGRFLVLKKTCR